MSGMKAWKRMSLTPACESGEWPQGQLVVVFCHGGCENSGNPTRPYNVFRPGKVLAGRIAAPLAGVVDLWTHVSLSVWPSSSPQNIPKDYITHQILGHLSQGTAFLLEVDDQADATVLGALDGLLHAVEEVGTAGADV